MDCTGRLVCWRSKHSESSFDVVQRADVKHQAADALFGLPATAKNPTVLDYELRILAIEAPNSNSFDLMKQEAVEDDYTMNDATQHPLGNAPPSENEIHAE